MPETSSMEDSSPSLLVKAMSGLLNEALQDLRKVAYFSKEIFATDSESCHSKTSEDAARLFSCLDINSLTEEYDDILNLFRKMPHIKVETLDSIKEDSSIIQFCADFKTLSDLLLLKISTTTSKSLFEMKESEKCFQKKYEELQAELKSLQREVEASRSKETKAAPAHPSRQESESFGLSTEDFQSQHPFFIKASAEEEIEFIIKVNENKLSHLRNKEKQSARVLKDAIDKHKPEMWKIIEETMQTRNFVDWIKEINQDKMKTHQEEQIELWQNFSQELLECRELCLKNRDMDKEYNEIMNEKRAKEENKQLAAVVTLQAHLRGYLTRKKYETLKLSFSTTIVN